MLRAIADIERNPGDENLMYPDPTNPAQVVCMRIPPWGIGIRWVDSGAAFEVTAVRQIFIG